MQKNNYLNQLLLFIALFIIISGLAIKYFNLTWVEVQGDTARVTINFLTPMEQETFLAHVSLKSPLEDCQNFELQVHWLSPQIVEIYVKEKNRLKGLEIQLAIVDAPMQMVALHKSEKIILKFNTSIDLLEQNTEKLITSQEAFLIHFNTPITLRELKTHLESDAEFEISPEQISQKSHQKHDFASTYLLQPKQLLKNGTSYCIKIKAGMRARSGSILNQDLQFKLKVDEKPEIIETYPDDGDQWIGLYPKITFSTQKPITEARARIEQTMLQATLIDAYHGYFILNKRLKPMTSYTIALQTKAPSGEKSTIKEVTFTTTSLEQQRGWFEIRCGAKKSLTYYLGTQPIKTMVCGIGKEIKASDYGTYYLQSKAEVYENSERAEGANYCLNISPQLKIHGVIRDTSWQIKPTSLGQIGGNTSGKFIILSDEDANWLYEHSIPQMMIIIRA